MSPVYTAFKGEWGSITEGGACAWHMRLPLVQYWWEEEDEQGKMGVGES